MSASNEGDVERARQELRSLIVAAPAENGGGDATAAERAEQVKRILTTFPQLSQERYGFRNRLPLHHAGRSGAPLEILRELVASFPESLTALDGMGQTPLSLACDPVERHFELEVYELLASPEVIRCADKHGNLLIHNYCFHGGDWVPRLEVVRLLVDSYPESLKMKGFYGTPLCVLCIRANDACLPVMRYLAEQYPQAVREHPLCLHKACSTHASVAVIQFLVESYPEAVCTPDDEYDGCLPLHLLFEDAWAWLEPLTVKHLLSPITRLLIETNPDCVTMSSRGEGTPLHTLLYHVQVPAVLPLVRLMVEARSKCVEMFDGNQQTPVHVFCDYLSDDNCLPTLQFLLETFPGVLSLRDELGCTPLHVVCQRRTQGELQSQTISYLASACPRVLEQQGGNDLLGTPFFELCSSNESPNLSLMEMLAISKAAVDVKDGRGRTPLHCLSLNGHVSQEALAILTHKSAGILSKKDNNGQIPLHIAAMPSSSAPRYNESIRCLLQAYPAGVHTTDENGKTPLELACEKNAHLSLIYQLVCVDPVAVLGLDSRGTKNDARKRQKVA